MTAGQDREFQAACSSFDADAAIEWLQKNVDPDDVFTESALEQWAKSNGWVKE